MISGAVTVALTVAATRWIFASKGAQLPERRDSAYVYNIKWQFRALGLLGIIVWIVILVGRWQQEHHLDVVTLAIAVAFLLLGVWIGTGSAVTDQIGITKKTFWRSHFLRWTDITEVLLHQKQGGAIELHAGSHKLVIDSRLNAFQHLRKEIEDRTQKQPKQHN